MRIHNRKIFATVIGICLFLLVMGETSAVPSDGLPMQSEITTSAISAELEQTVQRTPIATVSNLYPGAPIDLKHWIENVGTEDIYVRLSFRIETPLSSFSATQVPDGWSTDPAKGVYYYSMTGMYAELEDDWFYSVDDDRYYYKYILKPGAANKISMFKTQTGEINWIPKKPPQQYSYTMRIPIEWTNETMGIPIEVVAVATAMQAKNMNIQFASYPYWPV